MPIDVRRSLGAGEDNIDRCLGKLMYGVTPPSPLTRFGSTRSPWAVVLMLQVWILPKPAIVSVICFIIVAHSPPVKSSENYRQVILRWSPIRPRAYT